MRKSKATLTTRSINKLIRDIDEYTEDLEAKREEIARRLAEMWANTASADYATAQYDGPRDVSVEVVPTEGGYTIQVSGESVLFIEFGTGITYSGTQHPMAGEYGMGPGTWEPKHYQKKGVANWENPAGWYLPKEKGGGKTYGNPPSMTVYKTGIEVRNAIERIAREVFSK